MDLVIHIFEISESSLGVEGPVKNTQIEKVQARKVIPHCFTND